MTRRDQCRLEMLIRLRQFGSAHRQLFPDTSRAHRAFEAIAATIEELDALHVSERCAVQGSRVGAQHAARRALVDTLTRANATARVVARTNAGFEAEVEQPLPKEPMPLLTAARQFIEAIAPWRDEFAAHGIPITELEERVRGFEHALQGRSLNCGGRVKVRAQIAAAFSRAMGAVEVLDVNVANYLARDAVAQTVWAEARRIVFPWRRSQKNASVDADHSNALGVQSDFSRIVRYSSSEIREVPPYSQPRTNMFLCSSQCRWMTLQANVRDPADIIKDSPTLGTVSTSVFLIKRISPTPYGNWGDLSFGRTGSLRLTSTTWDMSHCTGPANVRARRM